jgi:hypothetical protein
MKPSKETFGCFGIPSWLNENVEHDTVLVHSTPEIVLHALDPHEHLIEVPLVTRSRTTAAQAVCEGLAKLLAPASNGLIRDCDAPLGQQEFNVSKAEAEHVIQPDRMADDLGGEAMAVAWVRWGPHAASLASLQPACQIQLL